MYIAGSGTPYWYEWEVGLLECLKMMLDSTVQSVVLQSVDFQSLDDVVVNHTDGSIINIQVKHTDVEEHFGYSTLSGGEHPMLKKWADEWRKAKDQYDIREIRIVTNRQWGPRGSRSKCSFKNFIHKVLPPLQADYEYQSPIPCQNMAKEWFKGQIAYLAEDAFEFTKKLNFQQEDDLPGVELKIRNYIARLLGTNRAAAVESATSSLLAKLSCWSTSRRERQEIFREDIYNALCIASPNLPDYEIYPEKPIFPSRVTFANAFLDRLQNSDKKVIFVQGLPGSGKTNFVSYLAQLDNTLVDFRFYTYLPVNKEHPSFSDDAGYYTGDLLWRSILQQLKKYFEAHNLLYELRFPLIYNYLSVQEMRETVLKYLPEYAKAIGRTCYLFIDGLDHAARARDARNSFLSQLPLPQEIDGNVKFVLVGQPINDKYPIGLINNNQVDYIDLPVLEEIDIVMLILNEGIGFTNMDHITLAKSIIEVVGNNALNVLFAIREVKRLQSDHSFDSIVSLLEERHLNSQIDRYYDWIVSAISGGPLLLKIKTIFAFASQKIKTCDISDMCGAEPEDVVFILNQLYPLVVCDSLEYYTFHNDVRLFFKESMVSNSNFETLALSIYRKIAEKENLTQYKYDIAFEMAFEMENKQIIFDLFSSNYIIESIRYNISVTKLVQQFHALAQLMVEQKSLENLDKISFAASTISQYINNIQYNEKEDLFYAKYNQRQKTESEKYVLSVRNNINTIMHDIYSLLKKGCFDRAKNLFDEYLGSITFEEYLNGSQDDSDLAYSERAGYICRFFESNIMKQDVDVESDKYLKFVKGWLDASTEFVSAEEIEKTFTFKYYRFEYLNDYTTKICNGKRLDVDSFNTLCKTYLIDSHNVPISSLVELCAYGIFQDYSCEALQQCILAREEDILESKEYKYGTDQILCYIKARFCLYGQYSDTNSIPKIYEDILQRNYIKPRDRGYCPAIDQFILSKTVTLDYYEPNADLNAQINTIYDTVYFTQQHGTGSSHDCNAYDVIRFLKKVLFYTHSKKSESEISKICKGIKNLYVWENARYVAELSELFYFAKNKEDYWDIAEHWCGQDGILWDLSYSEVEYIGTNIVDRLRQFGMIELAQRTKNCMLFKLIGYVDHKDYSLNGLLECYKCLPLSESTFFNQGMALLTISDKASSIGDNRMAGDIDDAVFETAVKLGVKYVNALFELKNNPRDFYYWRNCFLDAYYKRISTNDLPDDEIVALYNIVNAWINEEIETSVQRGRNQSEHLLRYNQKIIECIKDDTLRQSLISLKNYSPKMPAEGLGDTSVTFENIDRTIIDEISKTGYSSEAEQRIIASFSDIHRRQSKILIELESVIDIPRNRSFVSNCIVEYILRKRKYGYISDGLKEIIEAYCCYFSHEDWVNMLANIAYSISPSSTDDFYSVSNDIETLCLYYYKGKSPDEMHALCSRKLETHRDWLTSCGLTTLDYYTLSVNESIDSLAAFLKYQLGIAIPNDAL